jgi:hypothetical protein
LMSSDWLELLKSDYVLATKIMTVAFALKWLSMLIVLFDMGINMFELKKNSRLDCFLDNFLLLILFVGRLH